MTWKLWDEDGTWLTMLQGEQGVMTVDDSDDDEEDDHADEEDDHADTLARYGDLLHYENQQFLDMEEQEELLRCCDLIE